MRKILAALPLLLAWVVALGGTGIGLLIGLHPVLAIGNLLWWTGAAGYSLRVALGGRALWWLLPAAVLLASGAFHAYAFRILKQHYLKTQGPPRRYYSWD